jgi:hypothetical protein
LTISVIIMEICVIGNFNVMYGCKHQEYTSPLAKGDHPEIETTVELDDSKNKMCQNISGCFHDGLLILEDLIYKRQQD